MESIKVSKDNIAACGLYCGACLNSYPANAPDAIITRKHHGVKSANAA